MVIFYWLGVIFWGTGFLYCATFAMAWIMELLWIANGMGIFLMGLIVTVPGAVSSYFIIKWWVYWLIKKDFERDPSSCYVYLLPRGTSWPLTFIGNIFVHWIFVILDKFFPLYAEKIQINPQRIYPHSLTEKNIYWGSFIFSIISFLLWNLFFIGTVLDKYSSDDWTLALFIFWWIIFWAPIISLVRNAIRRNEKVPNILKVSLLLFPFLIVAYFWITNTRRYHRIQEINIQRQDQIQNEATFFAQYAEIYKQTPDRCEAAPDDIYLSYHPWRASSVMLNFPKGYWKGPGVVFLTRENLWDGNLFQRQNLPENNTSNCFMKGYMSTVVNFSQTGEYSFEYTNSLLIQAPVEGGLKGNPPKDLYDIYPLTLLSPYADDPDLRASFQDNTFKIGTQSWLVEVPVKNKNLVRYEKCLTVHMKNGQ